ncbi:AfsR/SARP family transcriptional regulator [Streptomyces sp. NPDC050263]|uniref:AfsR/SARP family transcriptional regulator n=1 Tax=Streptomyces sp. NPDC050263 TaxID=3155037 RepID=UPI003417B62D
MKLRAVLGNDRRWISHSPAVGYRMEVGDDEIDAALFEQLMGEGRRQLALGHASTSVRTLRSALALWRGSEALADVRSVIELEAEATRLGELRLQAAELAIEASLWDGAAYEVLPELLGLVIVHPLRERLVTLLLPALAAAGRRVEAADAYLRTRERFIDQIGIEPSAELCRIHQGVLRGDGWPDLLRLRATAPDRPGAAAPTAYAASLSFASCPRAAQPEHPGCAALARKGPRDRNPGALLAVVLRRRAAGRSATQSLFRIDRSRRNSM